MVRRLLIRKIVVAAKGDSVKLGDGGDDRGGSTGEWRGGEVRIVRCEL